MPSNQLHQFHEATMLLSGSPEYIDISSSRHAFSFLEDIAIASWASLF
jgi:hypothetical protein